MENFDLIVIGAGPAGCAAALEARRQGLSVVLLEKNRQPKLAPGETLHPGVEAIFSQLGVARAVASAGFRRHSGVWVNNGEVRKFVPYGSDTSGNWRGFQADRQCLHRILRAAASAAGAVVLTGQQPAAPNFLEARVAGVKMPGGEIFRGRWLIDASGRAAWLARQLKLDAAVRSPKLRARYGWRTAAIADDGEPEFSFRENGWDWRAPLADGQQAWVELNAAEAGAGRGGTDMTWRLRPQCAGSGYFLTGDAAALLDPASSHGVLRALTSGIFCAHLAAGCVSNRIDETDAIEIYRRWLIETYLHDERRMLELYRKSPLGRYFDTPSVDSNEDLPAYEASQHLLI